MIGYACLTIGVPNTGLSRCTLKNATEENLRKLTIQNLFALEQMIEYNIRNKIRFFRISSDIIPFGSHPCNRIEWWKDYRDILSHIGQRIMETDMRVSMHPGQYTVLNAPDQAVLQNAVNDLIYHDRFLTALGRKEKSKLVLHIGGVYGEKEKAAKTFIQNYQKLPQSVKDRLIIENDDKNYNISEVLSISHVTGAPVVFDNLHHRINPPKENRPEMDWIRESNKTWGTKDGKQKIHYSEQKAGGSPGAHSDTIFLDEFLEYEKMLREIDADIMLEVKDKNLSAIKCIHTAVLDATATQLEKEWERYRLFILSRSIRLYQELEVLMMEKEVKVARRFYEMVEQAYLLPEDKSTEVNAAYEVWEHFHKDCTTTERNRFDKLMREYQYGSGQIGTVKRHLLKCAFTRDRNDLIEALYFYI